MREHPKRAAVLWSSLAAALLLHGCSAPTDAEVVATARRQLDARDPAAATLTLKDALQRREAFGEARQLLARALLLGGDPRGAVVEARRALEQGADANATVPVLARALLASGDAQAVLRELSTRSLDAPAARAELQSVLAQAHAQLGQIEPSDAALAAALKDEPDHPGARAQRARRWADEGRAADAVADLRSLLATKTDAADAWVALGDLLLATDPAKGRDEAAKAYARALAADPRHLLALTAQVGLALQPTGVEGVAAAASAAAGPMAALQAAWPGHPTTLRLQAQLALFKGDAAAARQAAQQLLRVAPQDPRALLVAAEAELAAGAPPGAIDHLRKAITVAPGLAPPRVRLARLMLERGEPGPAAEALAPLLRDTQAPAVVLGLAAEAALQLERAAEAEALYRRAARAAPADGRWAAAAALVAAVRDPGMLSRREVVARLVTQVHADGSGSTELALARLLHRHGHAQAALSLLEAAVARHPRGAALPLLHGELLLARADAAGARRAFEQALERDPAQPEAHAQLGRLDVAEGQPERALARVDRQLAAQPTAWRLQLVQADLRQRTGADATAVLESISAAAQSAPGEVAPMLARVRYHLGRDEAAAALNAARTAQTAFPGQPDVVEALGHAQMAAGERLQAVGSFNKLVSMRPAQVEAWIALAQAQQAAGEAAAAKATLAKAQALRPDHRDILALQVQTALDAGRHDEALALARTAQKRQPAQAEGWLWEGRTLLMQGKPEQAVPALRQALQRQADGGTALLLFQALMLQRQTAAARKHAEEWLARHPAEAELRLALAQAALAEGDRPRADALLREGVERHPADPDMLAARARLLLSQGQRGAADLGARAVRQAPQRDDILMLQADALAAEGQGSKAVELLAQAVERAPRRHELRLHLARVALQAGDKKRARDHLAELAALGSAWPGQAEVTRLQQAAR